MKLSWSYSGDPMTTSGDAVRFEIQDVFSTAPLLADEEIDYAILVEGGPATPTPYPQSTILSAAARCCEALVRRFAMQADTEIGSLKQTYSKQSSGFADRAKELRAKAQGMHVPWIGGQSIGAKGSYAQDSDQVQPAFTRSQFNNPWAGPAQGYIPADIGAPVTF